MTPVPKTSGELDEQLKSLPGRPGVYLFKDRAGEILYVGKAKALSKRVRSYFHRTQPERTAALVERIAGVEIHVTDNELEALILECNLIKRFRPTYNVSYRDDKSYPYIAITAAAPFPRIYITRETHKPDVKYFGPYTNVGAVRETLDFLRRVFPVRTCSNNKFKYHGPCLDLQIDRCVGPCVGRLAADDYGRLIKQIVRFLGGRQEDVVDELRAEMKDAAAELEFERAARLRNQIQAATKVLVRQKVISTSKLDRDVLGVAGDRHLAAVELFVVRRGKLIGTESFLLKSGADDVLAGFIKQYYLESTILPRHILVPRQIEDQALLAACLSARRGGKGKVELRVPKRGDGRRLLELAERNARHKLQTEQGRLEFRRDRTAKALAQLKEELGLGGVPRRIECYDISTIAGTSSVGSMVVFEDGEPKRSDYRKFRVKYGAGQNDVAMMREILKRRLARLEHGAFGAEPDLVIVDGGKPQLGAARAAMAEAGVELPVVALAKREEEVYSPESKEPRTLPPASEALYLVKQIRDEAHRFAIRYHRSLRTTRMIDSILDSVRGVGGARKKRLLLRFGSPAAVAMADVGELAEVIPRSVAQELHAAFRTRG